MSEHDHDELPEAHDSDGDNELELDEEARAEHDLRKQVALSQIRQYGDPALRMRAPDVESFDEELRRVSDRMVGLMHDADGVGLAATQVGILRRFFVFHHDDDDHVLVNPRLVRVGGETETELEGCLSLGPVRVPVERPVAVTIEGSDVEGAPLRFELEGTGARVAQHELDHLNGTLMVDRTDAESRREALRQLRPRLLLR